MEENVQSTLLNHEHEDNKLNDHTIDTLHQEMSEDQCANAPIDITDLNPVRPVSSTSPIAEEETPSPKSISEKDNNLNDSTADTLHQKVSEDSNTPIDITDLNLVRSVSSTSPSAEEENPSTASGPVKDKKLDDTPSVAVDQEVSENYNTVVPIDTTETSRETPVSAAGSRRRFSRHESLQSIKVLSTNDTTSPTCRKEKSMVCKNCRSLFFIFKLLGECHC